MDPINDGGYVNWIEMDRPIGLDEVHKCRRISRVIGMPFENGMNKITGVRTSWNPMPFLVEVGLYKSMLFIRGFGNDLMGTTMFNQT